LGGGGGRRVLGGAEGGRGAPPPAAASALTRPARRSEWFACGRRRRPLRSWQGRSRWVPGLIAGEHGVQDDDQLAHARDQRDLGFLALGAQPAIVGGEHRIVPGGGAHDRHVEEVAQFAPAASDVPPIAALAAVVVIRGEAEQGGGGLVADLAE